MFKGGSGSCIAPGLGLFGHDLVSLWGGGANPHFTLSLTSGSFDISVIK